MGWLYYFMCVEFVLVFQWDCFWLVGVVFFGGFSRKSIFRVVWVFWYVGLGWAFFCFHLFCSVI